MTATDAAASAKRGLRWLCTIGAQLLAIACGGVSAEQAATLDNHRGRIKLTVRDAPIDGADGGLGVEARLEPAEDQPERPCPLFDLQARVNGRAAEVTTGGLRRDLSGHEYCAYPRIVAAFDAAELSAARCNADVGVALNPMPLPQQLTIELSDESGSFSANFRRSLPERIEMSVQLPADARLRPGQEVVVRFDPFPESIEELQLAFAREEGERQHLATLNLDGGGYELNADELRFTMPEAESGPGILTLSVTPWAPLAVECDFEQCSDSGLFHVGAPLSCSVPIEVLPP